MTHLLYIALCMVAAFLMVPIDGEYSENMEFESETEVVVECVRSTFTVVAVEPKVRIITPSRPVVKRPSVHIGLCSLPGKENYRIRYCVFRE